MSLNELSFLRDVSQRFTPAESQLPATTIPIHGSARFYADAQGVVRDSLEVALPVTFLGTLKDIIAKIDVFFAAMIAAPAVTTAERLSLDQYHLFKCALSNNPSLIQDGAPVDRESIVQLSYIVEQAIDVLETKKFRHETSIVASRLYSLTGIIALVGGILSAKWLLSASAVYAVALTIICVGTGFWNRIIKNELPDDIIPKVDALIQHLQPDQEPVPEGNN